MNKLSIIAVVFALTAPVACKNRPGDKPAAGVAANLDSLRAEGRQIARSGFEALSQKLMQAMEAGGVTHAISFCHANADTLTDSISARSGARVRRVAVRNRNPANAPDAQERALFEAFAAQKVEGRDLKTADTAVILAPGKVLFAKPILLQPQCLACHGKVGETVSEADYREIQKRYPGDRAVGFSPGDLRGMWAIYFE